MGNSSFRPETPDSKHISWAYFPFLVGSRLLFFFLRAVLHVNCFFSLSTDCMDRGSKEAATEHDGLHQKEARAVLSLLLSPPCDTRTTEAITWVKQSPRPSLSMISKKDTTGASTTLPGAAGHGETSWVGQGRIYRQGRKGMILVDGKGGGLGQIVCAWRGNHVLATAAEHYAQLWPWASSKAAPLP